jgi:hypothetical protein
MSKHYWFIVATIITYCQEIAVANLDCFTHTNRCGTTATYNTDQAKLGQIFFHHLIHSKKSFEDVNEHSICSLMHFFFQEATINGRPVQFSSGQY